MDKSFLYGFVAGYNFSRFTLTSLVVSGVTIYMYDPTIFQYEHWSTMVNSTLAMVSKI